MPIPVVHNQSGQNQVSVAWLRFVDCPENKRIVSGLLETAVDGSPLGFNIAQAEVPDCPSSLRHITRNRLFSALAKSLFQACSSSPALLFGLTGEISAQGFDGFNIGLPTGRISARELLSDPLIRSAKDGNKNELVTWINNRQPTENSEGAKLLRELLQSPHPFEPLARVTDGIRVSLANQTVNGLSNVYGSIAVYTLPSFMDYARLRNINASHGTERSVGPEDNDSDLRSADCTAQVWEVLGVAKERLIEKKVNTDLHWENGLMSFQRDGVGALVQMNRLLLSDDMGLGKTVQAIAALRILKSLGEMSACLVVAPASLLDQWRREFSKWAPELSVIIVRGAVRDRMWQWKSETDVKLISYESLRSDQRVVNSDRSNSRIWDAVVLDEAQRIKNRISISAIVKKIPRLRSWALTGTPIENKESELASIMEFVDHVSDADGYRNFYFPGDQLRQRHRDLQLRRKKSEVLPDLPEKLETKLTIDLYPNQQATYDKAEREGIVYLKSLGEEVEIFHILALITRLKQICNFDPKTGESSKLDDIKDRIGTLTAQDHKALVFSQYKSEFTGVAAIAQGLREFRPLTLTGDIPIPERSEVIEHFKSSEEHRVLILSLRVGGHGLNLQEASYVFHMDRWWNPAVERQAEDRSHRMGQTVKVNAIKYTCAATIEERIDDILAEKQALFDHLIDDVSIDLSASLTKAELLSLFGL